MANLKINNIVIPDCPVCGAQPTILSAFYGNAFYAECSQCGWEGNSRNIEMQPASALSIWIDKAIGDGWERIEEKTDKSFNDMATDFLKDVDDLKKDGFFDD